MQQSQDSTLLSKLNSTTLPQKKLQHRLYAKFSDSGRIVPNKLVAPIEKRGDSSNRALVLADETLISSIPDRGMKKSSSMARLEPRQFASPTGELSLLAKLPKIESKKHIEYDQPPLPTIPFPRVVGKDTISPFPTSQDPGVIKSILAQYRSPALLEGRSDLGASQILSQLKNEQTGGFRASMDQSHLNKTLKSSTSHKKLPPLKVDASQKTLAVLDQAPQTTKINPRSLAHSQSTALILHKKKDQPLQITKSKDKKKDQTAMINNALKERGMGETPFSFIKLIQADPNFQNQFCYCIRAGDFYNFKIVPFKEKEEKHSEKEFMTVSSRGIIHFISGEGNFMTIPEWEREARLFQKIKKISFFENYRTWKTFSAWKTLMRRTMIFKTSDFLNRELFILDSELAKPLLEIRRQTFKIQSMFMTQMTTERPRNKQEFDSAQEGQRTVISKNLQEIEKSIKQKLVDSCDSSMKTFKEENRISLNENQEEEDNEEAEPFLVGDETHKQMPYTQEATTRTHYKKLAKYIRLTDYMLIQAKLKLISNSIAETHQTLLKDFASGQKQRCEGKLQACPLFEVTLGFQGLSVTFSPSKEELKDSVRNTITDGVDTVCKYELFLNQPEFEIYTSAQEFDDHLFDETNDLMALAIGSEFIFKETEQTAIRMDTIFGQIEEYAQMFNKFLAIYDENKKLEIEEFREKAPQEIQAAMDQFISQSEQIDELETKFKIKICSLDSTEMKKTIRVSPISCMNKMKEFLPKLVFDKVSDLCVRIKVENEKVKIKPTKIDEFVEVKKNLIQLQEIFDNYMIEFGEIRSFNQLMDERHIKQGEKNKTKVKETDDLIKQTKKLMEQGLDDSEVHEMKFKKDLTDHEVPRLKRECQSLMDRIADDKFKTEETKMEDACQELEDMEEEVNQIVQRAKDLNEFQEYLEVPQTDFTVTMDLVANWKVIRNMWVGLRDWLKLMEGWVKTQFKNIQVASMQPIVDKNSKLVTEINLDPDLKDCSVAQRFTQKVETIKSTMPIVTSLTDEHMLQRHHMEVNKIVGQDLNLEDPEFTLLTLIEMDIKQHKEEIGEIQIKAIREYELSEAFKKVNEEWKVMPIELVRPKDRDDYWILEGQNIEEVRELLEDTMVRISNIQNAKYVDQIKEEVTTKYRELSEMDNLLTEFLDCQKNFTYLSNILRGDIIKDLPKEHNIFQDVYKNWKAIMDQVIKKASISALNILKVVVKKPLLQLLQEDNKKLEKIQHSLDTMLAGKRTDFGRFYFLSNDELLQILAEASTNPECIQTHLRKIFENVNRISFKGGEEITHMSSAEGEVIQLRMTKMKQGGNSKVESWLQFLLESMQAAVRTFIVKAYKLFISLSEEEKNFKRVQWVMRPDIPAQAVTVVGSILWTKTTEDDIAMQGDEPCEGIMISLSEHVSNLDDLTREVAKVDMEHKKRKAVVALITQDVHYRDILEELIANQVESPNDFKWQMQLRYNFDSSNEYVKVRQVNAELGYANEYLGCTTRLVITPLTDRCWMTITGALQLRLGAAPAGPAGTGKTESTKDLAKGLGTFCVVFNCSDQINYKMMEQLFSGLASTGSWACLDEFNRIDIEVLSVIAQQLLTIRNYLLWKDKDAKDNGTGTTLELEIGITKIPKPDDKLGVFITMNPGYKGRTELPDNLKVLFRPVSMMIPDYALIAEIMLFAEGFSQAKPLSRKMTRLYSLASEQLSQQPHYDFGMRAVKSVLVMAGQVKRAEASLKEDMVLIRAMRDSNIPKFLKDDVPLFNAIIQDLFPGVVMEQNNYPELEEAIEAQFLKKGLINDETLREKIIQFNETMNVRFGLMIIGPAMTGKTTVIHALKDAMNYLAEKNSTKHLKVQMETLNPKSISMAELYGQFSQTQEWTDGLASNIIREFVEQDNLDMKWTVFDGPVDALWIENMNTVLDDNMTLCLSNGERIRLKPCMKMVFEVDNLAQASPATVSRCGMVYASPSTLSWRPIVKAWLNKHLNALFNDKQYEYLDNLFENTIDKVIELIRGKEFKEPIPTVDNNHMTSMLRLLEAFLTNVVDMKKYDQEKQKKTLNKIFVYALAWSFGGSIDSQHHSSFEVFLSMAFNVSDLPRSSIFDNVFKTDGEALEFEPWTNTMPGFEYSKQKSYFELVVPTKDTVRYSWLLVQNIKCQFPVFITGITGVGKSIIISDTINHLKDQGTHEGIFLSFSSQTAAKETQLMIEDKLEKKRRTLLGGHGSNKVVLFVDDVNMPAYDLFGTQAPIELARTLADFMFVYDRHSLEKKFVENTTMVVCAAPPEGGRKVLTPRFTRHFHTLCLPPTQEDSLEMIFSQILNGFFGDFKQEIRGLTKNLVQSTIQIYKACSDELRPTPTKSHYTFNLRDISKIFQGMCMAKPQSMNRSDKMILLWIHEASRVFFDRLTTEEDKEWFNKTIYELATGNLRLDTPFEELFVKKQIMFCDFMKRGLAIQDRHYDEIKDFDLAVQKIKEYQMMYNEEPHHTNKFDLVMFPEAMQHICRITRILRQPRGSVLLVGVGGSGKQTLTRLSAFISDCQFFNVEVKKNYGLKDFRMDAKKPMMKAGAAQERSLFLLNDNQITDESFLEDINNLLNSGEIQGIWEAEDKEAIQEACRDKAIAANLDYYQYFVQKMRDNLNIVLCLSPVGESFRKRIRMFPSLVNCCGIDWVFPWPEQALYSVAKFFINQTKDIKDEELKDKIAQMSMFTHNSVIKEAEKFYSSLKRNVYVTPKSYLDLLQSYDVFLQEKKKKLQERRDTLFEGLTKLEETNSEVADLTQKLTEMQPDLEKQVIQQNALSQTLEKDQIEAKKKKEAVQADQRVVAVKTAEVEEQSRQANVELSKVDPIVKEATRAVENLTQKDITDAKTLQKPSETIRSAFQLVYMILVKALPVEKIEWKMCLSMIVSNTFFSNIKTFDKDNMDKAVRNKCEKFIRESENLSDEKLKNASAAAFSLGKWAKAIVEYSKIAENVAPLRKKVATLSKALEEQTNILKAKEEELAKEEAKVKKLEDDFQEAKEKMEALENGIQLCKARLVRAEKLTSGLKNEHERWKESVSMLDDKITRLFGDIFIATAAISYYGPFTGNFRESLVSQWIEKCAELEIPASDHFDMSDVMGDPLEIQNWNLNSLPADPVSVASGILVKYGQKKPLLIDPQLQASKWIKTQYGGENLKIIRNGDPKLMTALEQCVKNGKKLMIEDVGESTDPILEPVLLNQQFRNGQTRWLIKLEEGNPINYDTSFMLYLTTKIPNPHYYPESFIRVNVINFTVTQEGLVQQLLAEIVKLERPDIEARKLTLTKVIVEDQAEIKKLEDDILYQLVNSGDNVLDDQDLIDNLERSKVKSQEINERMEQNDIAQEEIRESRNQYLVVSERGTVVYFVIADMAGIDPMYQYSLSYFIKLFTNIIKEAKKSEEIQERIDTLMKDITFIIFSNICRGLFNTHKLIFSFMLAAKIQLESSEEKTMTPPEWDLFLKGVLVDHPDMKSTRKPHGTDDKDSIFDEKTWRFLLNLEQTHVAFTDLPLHITKSIDEWIAWAKLKEPQHEPLPGDWSHKLTHFQKMLVFKALRPEKINFLVQKFVEQELGHDYAHPAPPLMDDVYADGDKTTPIIFVLSPGAEPTSLFLRFAKKTLEDPENSCTIISLGQGQQQAAIKAIDEGMKEGKWVLLQNCHLFKSFMTTLEKKVLEISEGGTGMKIPINENFRLFLTSMPVDYFPVSVLQNGIKMTNEAPKGLRANMIGSLAQIQEDLMLPEGNKREHEFKQLLYSVSFFHAVIQERRKFGPLGWNNKYEFNESDLETAQKVLRDILMQDTEDILWQALNFVTGQIVYGGRVTDYWDRRSLMTILSNFLNEGVLDPEYKYSDSGIYKPVQLDELSLAALRQKALNLPTVDSPEIFGMHDNADIAFQLQESVALVDIVLGVQPRTASGGAANNSDMIVDELSDKILGMLPEALTREGGNKELFQTQASGLLHSLTTFLLQEVERFNELLRTMESSLKVLKNAIKGLAVMSEDLDLMYTAMLQNKVPKLWSDKAYPSLKPLGSWVENLVQRIEFIRMWIMKGKPIAYWFPSFFFPQGFMTALLQSFARKYKIPIDVLSFKFTVFPFYTPEQVNRSPGDGVYIYGLYLECGQIDKETLLLSDASPGQKNSMVPMIQFHPKSDHQPAEEDYICPLYKTSERAGTLTTTGHSTNFVIGIELSSLSVPEFWIKRGTALLCQLDN